MPSTQPLSLTTADAAAKLERWSERRFFSGGSELTGLAQPNSFLMASIVFFTGQKFSAGKAVFGPTEHGLSIQHLNSLHRHWKILAHPGKQRIDNKINILARA
jgi:hypothetical protein